MEEKADDHKEVEKKKLLSLTGPTTLTSLMTQDKKSKDGKDYVYVHIGELMANEIFVSLLLVLNQNKIIHVELNLSKFIN